MPRKKIWDPTMDGFHLADSEDPRFKWALEIMDLWEAVGKPEAERMAKFRGARFSVCLALMPVLDVLNEDTIRRVKESYGMGDDEWDNESLLYDVYHYGIHIPWTDVFTKTEDSAYEKGRRIKRPTVQEVLAKIVNQMGQSGFEFIEENLDPDKYTEMEPNATALPR